MAARISIIYRFADGNVLQVHVKADSSYPDSLAEARAVAHREFAEDLALIVDEGADDGETTTPDP